MEIPDGEFEKGKKMFMELCSNCHNISSVVMTTGPEESPASSVIWKLVEIFQYLKNLNNYILGNKVGFRWAQAETRRRQSYKVYR
ncbi:putative cytochrome c [Aphelenchoides besseyi]|nr:putative cytochrome c [Aphelenchoides besseyi]